MTALPPLSDQRWQRPERIARCLLAAAPAGFVEELRTRLQGEGITSAVDVYDTAAIFDWIVERLALQGISNAAAWSYAARNTKVTWRGIELLMLQRPSCPRLQCYWSLENCRFHKGSKSCSEPEFIDQCPLPTLSLRKGSLHQAALGLWLFVRDVGRNDLVGWIDERLRAAHSGGAFTLQQSRRALVDPLSNIPGTGPKIWSMILAELLLVDPTRELWVSAGAALIAVDSLVHAYFDRTGTLRRLGAEHAYGPACYRADGCVGIIEGLSQRIDARAYGSDYPAYFPRLVQFAIWWHCAEGGSNFCNARKIDDRLGCRQSSCPAFDICDRLPIDRR